MKVVNNMNKKKSDFQFDFILGIFIFSSLLGLFFCIVLFDLKSWLFWFFAVWTFAYAVIAYLWSDQRKWELVEKTFLPALEDIGTLLFILVPLIGCIYTLYNVTNGIETTDNLISFFILLSMLIFDFIMIRKKIYTFNLIEYLKKRKK